MLLVHFQKTVILILNIPTLIIMMIITQILTIHIQHQMMTRINTPILGHLILKLLQLNNGQSKPLLQYGLQLQLLSGQLQLLSGHLRLLNGQLHQLSSQLHQLSGRHHQLSGRHHQLSGQLQANLQHTLIEEMIQDLIETDHLFNRRFSEQRHFTYKFKRNKCAKYCLFDLINSN